MTFWETMDVYPEMKMAGMTKVNFAAWMRVDVSIVLYVLLVAKIAEPRDRLEGW